MHQLLLEGEKPTRSTIRKRTGGFKRIRENEFLATICPRALKRTYLRTDAATKPLVSGST